jgi:gliding motility-associated lipoprotein GldD
MACGGDYYPKPRGYFRIDLPEKQYKHLDSIFPFVFDYPVYSSITSDVYSPQEKNWINLNFKRFKGSLHLSYKKVDGNLNKYMEDSRAMVFKHIPKATAIDNCLIFDKQRRIFGLIYEISGSGAASPYQFFVTDSVNHFLRGALYFNIVPNNDSLAPVIDFLKKDIEKIIETIEWK